MLSGKIFADVGSVAPTPISPCCSRMLFFATGSRTGRCNRFKSLCLPPGQSQADVKSNAYVNWVEEEDVGGRPKKIIQVPRQKYIPVSKPELLDAISMSMFDTPEDVRRFLDVATCLDSVLHAEQKSVLEELRADYSFCAASDDEDDTRYREGTSMRFQRALMQLLQDAQFEELSMEDLILVSALNTDYLLTLPVTVDWNKASRSKSIIFRRGYTTEKQKGLLLAEKLDYLQSKLLQRIIFVISKPLAKVASWMVEGIENISSQELKSWANKMKDQFLVDSGTRKPYTYEDKTSGDKPQVESELAQELPIWVAAQKAIARYEVLLSSAGPRGRLLRRFLVWTGLVNPAPETKFEYSNDNNSTDPYLRPIFLSRISIGDIWKPAAEIWYGNNIWEALKTSISILSSQSFLQEAAFKELILVYLKEVNQMVSDSENSLGLQLQIYKSIPIPDLPVIFPNKELSFRIIDSVRLDVASVLGLLAYIINYKFEDILSSPYAHLSFATLWGYVCALKNCSSINSFSFCVFRSAILLDAVATTALIVLVIRVALGYKQTRDRYQLLVNKTLYEKTVASGFGTIHFLLDASEQQKFKEAILVYAVLLRDNNSQVNCRWRIKDECERFMYNVFKQPVEMPVDKAVETLLGLGLVTETYTNGRVSLQAVPCHKAYQVLKERWNTFIM